MSSISPVQTLTAESFSEFVGDEFQLSAGPGQPVLTVLTLLSVSISKWCAEDGRPGFSLIFTGPGQPALPQHLFRLAHATLGDLDIFLVPISGDSERREYQAVFN